MFAAFRLRRFHRQRFCLKLALLLHGVLQQLERESTGRGRGSKKDASSPKLPCSKVLAQTSPSTAGLGVLPRLAGIPASIVHAALGRCWWPDPEPPVGSGPNCVGKEQRRGHTSLLQSQRDKVNIFIYVG